MTWLNGILSSLSFVIQLKRPKPLSSVLWNRARKWGDEFIATVEQVGDLSPFKLSPSSGGNAGTSSIDANPADLDALDRLQRNKTRPFP